MRRPMLVASRSDGVSFDHSTSLACWWVFWEEMHQPRCRRLLAGGSKKPYGGDSEHERAVRADTRVCLCFWTHAAFKLAGSGALWCLAR
jgi:hypothetical protein